MTTNGVIVGWRYFPSCASLGLCRRKLRDGQEGVTNQEQREGNETEKYRRRNVNLCHLSMLKAQ